MSLENWSLDAFILLPAMVAGLVVLATHIPLGIIVLKKGIIFIDLAIAQVAGLGVILAYSLGWDIHHFAVQLVAVSSAILGAVSLYYLEKHYQDCLEAIIGVVFVLAACSGLLLLANNPHGGEYLKDLLSGQILWVSWEQIGYSFGLSLVLLGIWYKFRLQSKILSKSLLFYIIFALAVTASVQLVGVYLVFSSLIIPALWVKNIRDGKLKISLAYVIGMLGYLSGLILSSVFDLPSGALIVWTLVLSGPLVLWIFSSRSGRIVS